MLCHASAFAFFFLPFLGNILGPLVIWLARRDVDPRVREHGASALNFQITVTLVAIAVALGYAAAVILGGFFLSAKTLGLETMPEFAAWPEAVGAIGVTLGAALTLVGLFFYSVIMVVVNTIRASDGHAPKYWPDVRLVGKSEPR